MMHVTAKQMDPQELAEDFALLGYPGYIYLRPPVATDKSPSKVLLTALVQNNLEPRLIEALPWLLLRYCFADLPHLIMQAKNLSIQNRLGFLVNIARRMSEGSHNEARTLALSEAEALLDESRLADEDDFMRCSRNVVEREWLMQNRPEEAKYWKVVTDLRPERIEYDAYTS